MTSLLSAAGLAILASMAQGRPPQQSPPLIVAHVNVIDVATGSVWSDRAVEVRGDRITAVLPATRLKIGPGARVIDARGGFLIPGLWDMHAHVSFFGREHLSVFLANGVTGVRDLGGIPDTVFKWRREVAAGTLLGPRIEAAGLTLDRGAATPAPHIASVRTRAEARSAVRSNADAGAATIKVWSNIPREAFLAAAEEARRRDLPLVGHPPIQVGLVEAVEAGQRGIEHTISIPIALASRQAAILADLRNRVEGAGNPGAIFGALIAADVEALASRDESAARRVIKLLAGKRVWVCPTLTDSRAYTVVQDSVSTDTRFRHFPAALKEQWEAEAKGMSAVDIMGLKALFPAALRLVGELHRAGVGLLAGTDAGSLYDFPGFDLHTELALMVRAGLTPLEALRTATRNPAAALGLADRLGAIAPGNLADLVLLEADPLVDIRNTARIAGVVTAGRYLDRAALERLLTRGQ